MQDRVKPPFRADHVGSLIRPDVLIKGADYAEDQVVGADLVKGWGGEVRLAQLVDGYSTTAAIARINGKTAPRTADKEQA